MDAKLKADSQKNALSEITNFIAQEIYKLALFRQYPQECSHILTVNRVVQETFQPYNEKGFDSLVEDLRSLVLDLIVYGVDENEFFERTHRHIAELDRIIIGLPLMAEHDDTPQGSDDYSEYEISFKSSLFQAACDLFKNRPTYEGEIYHQYPPHTLTHIYNYNDILDYYYGMAFLPSQKGNTTTITSLPTHTRAPSAKRVVHQIKPLTEELSIPDDALSNSVDDKKSFNIDDAYEHNLFELKVLKNICPIELIKFTSEIRFRIDTSEPLTNLDLDKAIATLRVAISHAQSGNENFWKFTATNRYELNRAFNIPKLAAPEISELYELHKAFLPGLKTLFNAKNYLLGLIMVQEHFFQYSESGKEIHILWKRNADAGSALKRANHISARISNKHGKEGFAPDTIMQGMKLVNNAIQVHLDDLQFGRVQFNIRLNASQRAKLNNMQSVSTEDLHPYDREKAEKIISRHEKNGRNAAIKQRRNGSFVISW
ncbi:hypothetical protein [Dickeya oryzae]